MKKKEIVRLNADGKVIEMIGLFMKANGPYWQQIENTEEREVYQHIEDEDFIS